MQKLHSNTYQKNGFAISEYDIGYKPNAFFDLYVPSMNTLFEMQSEYHDNEKSQIKDENKRIFAESLGYIVKYVDVRTDNVFDFIKQIDSTASIDDIIQSVDLSLITNSHIVQFDTDNNVVNIFKGGLPEIKNRLGYSMSSISRACNGVNYGSGHFSHGYLWHKKSDYNNRDIQTITEYQIHQSTIKENKYIYIAISVEVLAVICSFPLLAM